MLWKNDGEIIFCYAKCKDASLLVQKGYESNIIAFDDIVFCEIIDRKIYLHLKTEEVIDYYDRIENLETKLDGRFLNAIEVI